MIDEERARAEIIDVCRRLYEKGWVANHDGNLSVRVGEDRIVATPTAVGKGDVRPEQLIVVDLSGRKIEGTRKPFSELTLHLKAYRARADVKAVVHAHPVTASGFAVAGVDLDPTFMPEAVVSLGDRIPTARFALPYGEDGAAPLDGLVDDYDAVLLANHGAITFGCDLWTAFYRMELVEHLAKIQLVARQLGRVNALSPEHIATLLERRKGAGLGPEARGRARASAGSAWGGSSGWSGSSSAGGFSGSSGSGGWAGGGEGPRIPEGAAPSAWTGPYPVGLCSGERFEPPAQSPYQPPPGTDTSPGTGAGYQTSTSSTSSAGYQASGSSAPSETTSRAIPSNEELQRVLEREVARILGK